MESVLKIMEKTKRTREKEEQIATLETENTILHIKIAQLLHTIKNSPVSMKPWTVETEYRERCRKCDTFKEKTVLLNAEIKSLRKQVTELQIHHSSLRQQIGDKLQNLQTILPAIVQQHTHKQNDELQAKYFRERCRRKALHNALVELRGNIRVHCRVRPVLGFDGGEAECVRCTDDETVGVSYSQSFVSGLVLQEKVFEFDRVHPPSDSQAAVFSDIQPLIVSLLDGYNVCIMAYGQTGSGKTHTMLGSLNKSSSERDCGVLPRAVRELFRLIEEREIDASVNVSIVEIYNEKIRDLLRDKSDGAVRKNEIVANRNGSMEVTNLTIRPVSSNEELIAIVNCGTCQRAVTSTLIHEHSSRSHLIVTVHISQATPSSPGCVSANTSLHSLDRTITPVHSVESTPVVSPDVSPPFTMSTTYNRSGLNTTQKSSTRSNRHHYSSSSEHTAESYVKLQFVDLAGSECIGMSGASGSSLKEAQYINKSLSSLSDVLGALAEKRSHIPYRNSTLTHLLQDTIGGDAKMVMLLCVSPTVQYVGESLRVLRFGKRARQVRRRVNHHNMYRPT